MNDQLRTTRGLLGRVEEGDFAARELLFARYGPRVRRMVRLRIDRRIRPRIDEDDVVQEVLLEVAQRLPDYLENPVMPFFVWLRFLAMQRLAALHRHHLGVKARDARREVRLDLPLRVSATSAPLADVVPGRATTPTQGAARSESRRRIEEALALLGAQDREILTLRHFEHLSNAEAARALGVDVSAASKRYMRSLHRLSKVLSAPAEAPDAP